MIQRTASGDARSGDMPGSGWAAVAWRVKREIFADRLSLVAAGVAFFAVLAVFPAMSVLGAAYGLLFDQAQMTQHLSALDGVLPRPALDLIRSQLHGLRDAGPSLLRSGVVGGALLTLWSASTGVRMLIKALNVAYDATESRGFLARNALAVALTLAALVGVGLGVTAALLVPSATDLLGIESRLGSVVYFMRWPVVGVVAWLAIVALYRYGPCRERVAWSRVARGAVVATLLWLAGSALFSWYIAHSSRLNQSYGSMGAAVALMIWFLLSAWAVLIGAEVNAALERQRAGGRASG